MKHHSSFSERGETRVEFVFHETEQLWVGYGELQKNKKFHHIQIRTILPYMKTIIYKFENERFSLRNKNGCPLPQGFHFFISICYNFVHLLHVLYVRDECVSEKNAAISIQVISNFID